MTNEEIISVVSRYIISEFRIGENDSSLNEEIDLFENGFVDSVGIVRLISFMEEKFGIKFSEETLYDDRFSSLNGLANIISELKHN